MKKTMLLKMKDVDELINTTTVISEAKDMCKGYSLEIQLKLYVEFMWKVIDTVRNERRQKTAFMKYQVAVILLSHLSSEEIRKN